MRGRSIATELRETKRDLRQMEAALRESQVMGSRLGLRLHDTQRELSEWKARFDELLKRVPEVSK